MTRIALSGGSYQARSLAASAQRVLNVYQEIPPPSENAGSPPTFYATAPPTYYETPGLVLLASTTPGVCRGLYRSSQNAALLFAVIGPNVVSFNAATSAITLLGTISSLTTPVFMQDNGLVLIIADGTVPPTSGIGSPGGWVYSLTTGVFGPIDDAAWLGASGIVFLDTYLLFIQPGTAQWYSSPSNYLGNSTPFDPLYIASKTTYPDILAAMACVNGLIWLIGTETTEAWYDAGAADFPFQRVPQVLIQHGCIAPASIVANDGAVYFLSQDPQGQGVVLVIEGEGAERISTFPIEYAISRYGTITDAVGMTYQSQGHTFYVLTFPTADKTWVYDIASQLWHERCSLDSAGAEHAVLFRGLAYGGTTIALDATSGAFYRLDPGVFTDNGAPIKRQRCFAHMIGDGTRIFYRRFIADMASPVTTVAVALDWSDDRGLTYGNPVSLTLNANSGDALTWWRLGYARDRVFRLTWTSPAEVALQGAWIVADGGSS
jgi:hypothetical protein